MASEKGKKSKNGLISGISLLATISILLGLVLLIFPKVSQNIIIYTFGGILCLLGIVNIIIYFQKDIKEGLIGKNFAFGLLAFAGGVYIISRPMFLINVITIIFGIVVIIGGAYKIQIAFDLLRMNNKKWYFFLVFAVVMITLGILILIDVFNGNTTALMRFCGICLVAEGALDFVTVIVFRKMKKIFLNLEEKMLENEEIE